jgi:hypothetical protein
MFIRKGGEYAKLAYIGESEYMGISTPGPGEYQYKVINTKILNFKFFDKIFRIPSHHQN